MHPGQPAPVPSPSFPGHKILLPLCLQSHWLVTTCIADIVKDLSQFIQEIQLKRESHFAKWFLNTELGPSQRSIFVARKKREGRLSHHMLQILSWDRELISGCNSQVSLRELGMLFQVNCSQTSATCFPEMEKSSQNCFPEVKLRNVVSITYLCHCHSLLVLFLLHHTDGLSEPLCQIKVQGGI